ncbi:MAG: T9SS type A sorting domain-containing protein [Bernardetiaceae bacterium]
MNLKTTTKYLLHLLWGLLIIGTAQAQKGKNDVRVIKRVDAAPTICHFVEEDYNSRIRLRPEIREAIKNGRIEEKSTFIPIYASNFPDEAKPAIEFALAIWGTFLPSDVPIYASVNWIEQSGGTLASAGPAGFYLIEEGPFAAFYPAPLAEKIVGRSINANESADMNIFVGDRRDWYYGTDGEPGGGQFDLVTIILHEVGHGLGFTGSGSMNARTGSIGGALQSDPDSRFPFAYDVFAENGDGQSLFKDFPNNSVALGDQLTGDNLFFNAPLSFGKLGERPQLYAPRTWSQGSSYSHLDEARYPVGNPNSLMSPQIGFNEVIHDPGITFDIFADMGWIATRLAHTPYGDTENSTTPYPIAVTIKSDTSYDASQVNLSYSFDGTSFTTTALTPAGAEGAFSGQIPNGGTNLTVSYYISVPDASGRTFTSPGAAPEDRLHTFRVGADTVKPRIIHDPVRFIVSSAASVDVIAGVTDNLVEPLSSVRIEYAINGAEQTPVEMQLDASPRLQFVDQTYSGVFRFAPGSINPGDVLEYQIIAVDGSVNRNTRTAPEDASTRFSVRIEEIFAAAETYENDFSDAATANDFIGTDFIFDQPAGFSNPALHSPHPYPFADEIDQTEINMIHQLKVPIIIKPNRDDAVMTFNEIALVEPGEPGVPFGEAEFWDFVIVEGSTDNGTTWKPFLDGYDARAQGAWLSLYNNTIQGNDSQGSGNSGLFRERTIFLQDAFNPGDQVLIRFRLFSDPFARGWGWAIDDLRIQAGLPLAAPRALPATDIVGDGFTANWEAVADARDYLLDVSTTPLFSSFVTGFEGRTVTGTSFAVTGLAPNTGYFYRLRARDGERISDFSNNIAVTTADGTPTGLEDYVDLNTFRLFPNPTSGELSLNVDFVKATETIKVRVTDMLGKTIMQETYRPEGLNWQHRLSLSGQASGMYLVTIEVDGGLLTKKIFLNQ